MGSGFTAPPTYPDSKESGGRLEEGEVTLNGKAASFHFWLQASWMLCPIKPGFVFVFCRNLCRWGQAVVVTLPSFKPEALGFNPSGALEQLLAQRGVQFTPL